MGKLNEREITRRYLDRAVDLLEEGLRDASYYVSPEFLDRVRLAQSYLVEAGDRAVEGYASDCPLCVSLRAEEDAVKQECRCELDCCNKASGDEEVGEADNSYHTAILNRLYPIIETLIQMRGEVQSGVGFINQPINSNNKEYLNEAIGSLRDLELALRVEQAVNAHA